MAGFSESLSLDIAPAMRDLDTIEARLGQAGQQLSVGVAKALDLLRDVRLDVAIDTASLTQQVTAAVDAADTTTAVEADTAGITREVESAVDAADTSATFELDTTEAQRNIDQVAEKAGGIGGLIASAAVVGGIARITDAASGLQQAVGGTAAVFGEASDAVDDFAEGAAESVGLSERAAREATSQLGALFKGFGFAADEAAEKAIELTTIGADLAATFGGTTADAVEALSSALRGETDPIERYGISLRATTIDARAVALGLADTTTAVDTNARAQAALTLISEGSAGALGQFAREAESAAGQAQIAGANAENAAAAFGDSLLPVTARVTEALGFLASGFGALPDQVQTGIVAVAGIAAVAGPLGKAKDSIKGLADAFRDLPRSARVAAGGLALVATALIDIQNLNADKASKAEQFFDALTTGGGAASRAMEDLVDEGLRAAGVFDDFGAAGLDAADLIDAVEQKVNGNTEAFEDLFNTFQDAGGNVAAFASNDMVVLTGALEDAFVSANNVKDGIDAVDIAARGAAGGLDEIAGSTSNAADEAERYADELDDGIRNLREVFGLQSSASEASIAFRDTLRGLADEAVRVADGTLTGAERVDRFASMLIEGRDNALDYAEALVRTGSTTDEAVFATQGLISDLLEAADAAGLSADEVNALAQQYGLLPEQITTTIESNLPRLSADVQQLEEDIRALAIAFGSDFTADVSGGPRFQSFATGGFVDQVPFGVATRAIVHGGELILNPAQQTAIFAGAGASAPAAAAGTVINLNQNNDLRGTPPEQVLRLQTERAGFALSRMLPP